MNDLIDYIINSSIIQGNPTTSTNKNTFDGSLERHGNYAERSRKEISWHAINGTDIPSLINASVSGVVGSGINIQCRTESPDVNVAFEALLKEHSKVENFEVTARWFRNEASRQKQRFHLQSGGLLIRHRYSIRWKIPYKQELIGVDMIDTLKDNFNTNTLNGLKKDQDGKVIGIWLFKDYNKYSHESRLISTKDMVFYNQTWMSLSQYTAASKLAVILPMLEKALAYSQAELDAAIERAKAGTYWHTELYDMVADALRAELKKATTDQGTADAVKILQDSIKAISNRGIQPQGATAIPKEDTITEISNKSDSQYSTFSDQTQKSMAAATGSSQVSAYKDIEKGNYSSIKAAISFDEEGYKMDFDYMINIDLEPYCERLFQVGVQIGAIPVSTKEYFDNPAKYHKFDILRQSKRVIDEQKQANANAKNLISGTTTLSEIYAEKGQDQETQELKQERIDIQIELKKRKMRKAAGLPVEPIEKEDND